ncbi:MAG: Bifunctional protein Aas [Chlamydiales bacterium]|nr:Bifunctional protein Aas [Chlamydiales bacterium]MCH9635971.1 Bifunctional protein Aas [Chlamydiales bacterium]MCH9703283.1 1-acyl-sn-glycerol-3-phosphate acyltransferase [Chlamydiota bacterium]
MIFRTLASVIVFCYLKIFFRLRVVGKENIPKGAAILAANHASFIDPPLMGCVMWPDVPFFLARGSLFNSKVLTWMLKQCRSLPIKRGEENAALFRQVIAKTKEGYKVALFPEGTRTTTGEFQEALPGIGLLVMRSKSPVVPIYVDGTYDAWSCHRKKPKLFGRITIVFGKPIDFSKRGGDRKELQRAIGGEIMDEIRKLRKALQK